MSQYLNGDGKNLILEDFIDLKIFIIIRQWRKKGYTIDEFGFKKCPKTKNFLLA